MQIWEKREKSQRCFISGLEKSHNGVDFSKCGSFVFWRKVILVQLRAPLWLFSQTKVEAPWWLFSFFSNLHQYDFSPEQNGKSIGRNVIMVLTFFFFEPYRGSRGLPLVFLDCFMYFLHLRFSGALWVIQSKQNFVWKNWPFLAAAALAGLNFQVQFSMPYSIRFKRFIK